MIGCTASFSQAASKLLCFCFCQHWKHRLIQTSTKCWDFAFKQWNQPQSKKCSLEKIFEKKRKVSNKAAATFKCTASEALGLLPLVSYFLFTVVIPHGHCLAECNAYFALADLIELIQLVPLGKISPDSIAESSQIFISKCLDAKWESRMHTKFHWCLHMAGHLQKHRVLPSCFVQERKHKVVKRHLVLRSA